ncbi:BED-type domain-containing protein [Citrus sinensis]|nr:BED-type domain-containing protein [Citrus sinensis]
MRCFNQKRYEAINTEVEKLLKAGFIREAKYPEWISNVVLVKKANGKWRMCVDFTDLNKTCPKDSFPLPKIDQLVDSTAGATYQRLVNKIFKPLIGHTIEVYVDDMITKSKEPRDHVKHLEETFELLRKYEMKLNPDKCAFGVSSGKFLGFLPLWQILQKSDASGRLVKWSVELSEFDLSYRPRGAIKTQVLAEFMVDQAEPGEEIREEQLIEQEKPKRVWLMEVNSSSNPGVNISTPSTTQSTTDSAINTNAGNGKGGKASKVWEHYTKLENDTKCKCNYCSKVYAYHSRFIGTRTLWNHLAACTAYADRKVDLKQKTLVFEDNTTGGGSNLVAISCSKEDIRKACIEMIIIDELPFSFVEKEGFRKFMSKACPKLDRFSRRTVARDVYQLYLNEKNNLKKVFARNKYRVCITTDCWTSIQNLNYMVITAHFIDDEWQLHKRILNFCQIDDHKGDTIGKLIESCLLEWGIDRVFTITVDNASSNDLVISYLKKKLNNWGGLVLNGDYLHVRCCAHIINLIVTEGLKEMNNSVSSIRNAVKYVRSSPARLVRFRKCVEHEKLDSKRIVVMDVPTRWNSTYLMLESALVYQKAFERLEDDDGFYRSYFEEKEGGKKRIGPPEHIDWVNASVLNNFLENFYEITKKFSASLSVTSHLYFHEMHSIESNLKGLIVSDDSYFSAMAKKMKEKYDKYWGSLNTLNKLLIVAVVLDPRYKLSFVKFCFEELYDENVVCELIKVIKGLLSSLYDFYTNNNSRCDSGSQNQSVNAVICPSELEKKSDIIDYRLAKVAKLSKWKKKQLEEDGVELKNEVDKYLLDDCENCFDDSFDLLNWWKVNGGKYKVLSNIAKDILSIPISTVASESAFSTGGRILDPFRASLSPKMVESLICGQNWLCSSRIAVEEDTSSVEDMAFYESITSVKFEFQLTNNQAEYEAFIIGLGLAHALRAERVEIRADSQLVCNQLNDQFQARGEKIGLYLKKAKQMVGFFEKVEVKQISRNENYRADMLARMAAIADPKLPKSVPLEVRTSLSIGEEVEVMRVSTGESWMDPIRAYVCDGVLPEDKRQARKLKCQAARYTLLDGVLYRREFTLPLLRCLDDEEADYVLREIHEGICGNHSGARTLAFKALRQGYFWPTLHQDAKRMAKNCKTCQSFSEIPAQPPEKLTTMTSPYGIPYAIITDNGRQFDNSNFREFCRNLGVDLKSCTPAHPQTNRQVEAANKVIKKLLKTKLGEKKGAWVDELPGVLWAYRTTHKTAIGETSFALPFGHEAVVPAEIRVGTHRTEYFTEEQNDEQICLSLDLFEEKKEGASQKVAQCQQRVMRYYNKNVRVRQFRAGDWVLRKVNQNTRDPNHGTLGPKWEGPYRVIRTTGLGAYKLAYQDGRDVKRS